MLDKSLRIAIIGGSGTFGASTALELARRGFKNVTTLDVYPCPSEWSAGNDLNKIIRSEYSDLFYSKLAEHAIDTWKSDSLLKPYFHNTGWVVASSDLDKISKWKGLPSERILSPDELQERVPQLEYLGANASTWSALWNPQNGWVAAKDALQTVSQEAERLGVHHITGPAGHVTDIHQTADGKALIKTKDGSKRTFDKAIVCVGAWIDTLVDMQQQCHAKCWTVGHIQLTSEECQQLKGMPVFVDAELGFFFEPSEQEGKIKMCNEFPGYQHRVTSKWHPDESISAPSNTLSRIPHEAASQLHAMREKLLPRFADRPIIDEHICWCADSSNGSWIIDFHPEMSESILLATGDSGMAFKFLPTIGGYIADALETRLDEVQRRKWAWRSEDAASEEQFKHRRGDGRVKDLKEFEEWRES
ncbi:unnamed protein product [Sympodiomycopsis kandeliae]